MIPSKLTNSKALRALFLGIFCFLGNSAAAATPSPCGSGLWGQYYNSINFSNFVGSELDPSINYIYAAPTGPTTPAGVNATQYSVIWSGYVTAPSSENYTFSITVDDGAILTLNGNTIISAWMDQPATSYSSTPIAMTAGQAVPLTLQYYNDFGGSQMTLSWSAPNYTSGVSTVIGQCFLSPNLVPTPVPTPSFTPIPASACPQSDPFNGGSLASYWYAIDINPVNPGSQAESGSLTVSSQSEGILSGTLFGSPTSSDGFRYIFQAVNDNFDVMLQVLNVPSTNSSGPGRIGLEMRDSEDESAVHAFIGATENNDVRFTYRSSYAGSGNEFTGPAITLPVWVRLTRSGNSFSAYYSQSLGAAWAQVGTTQTIPMSSTYLIGVAESSQAPNASTGISGSVGNFTILNGNCSGACHPILSAISSRGGASRSENLVAVYNPCSYCQDVGGMEILSMGSAACGTSSASVFYTFPSGTIISPGQYRIVVKASGFLASDWKSGSYDFTTSQSLPFNGAVELYNPLTSSLEDLVGFTGDSCFEGGTAALDTLGNQVAVRYPSAASDTNQNYSDFSNISCTNYALNNGGGDCTSATNSPTPNPDSSQTATPSPSGSPTASPSPTPNFSGTASATSTRTASTTPTRTPSATPSLTVTPTQIVYAYQVSITVYDSSGQAVFQSSAGGSQQPIVAAAQSCNVLDPSRGSVVLSSGAWSYIYLGQSNAGKVLSNGSYLIELNSQGASGSSIDKLNLNILLSSSPLDSLLIGPNPINKSGEQVHVLWTPPGPVNIRIFNLAGNLVRSYPGLSGGSAILDTRSNSGGDLSDGIYLLSVVPTGLNGGWTRKLAIAR